MIKRYSFINKKPRYVILHRQQRRATSHLHKHPAFFVPALTFGGLTVLCVIALVVVNRGTNPIPQLTHSDTKIAIVTADKAEQAVPTRAKTVGELLSKLQISLHEGDVVEPVIDTEIVSDNFRINVYRAKPVTIVDGNTVSHALSAATTPRSILDQAGIIAYPEDVTNFKPVDDFVTEGVIGQTLEIDRSTLVKVNLYGTQTTMRTQAKSVGEFLDEKNIKLASGETVQPNVASPIDPNEPIFVNRRGFAIETRSEDVPFEIQYIDDKNLTFGVTAVRQEGVAGRRIVTYQINTETNQRSEFHVITVQNPIPKLVARGTYVNIPSDKQAVMSAAGIRVGDYSYVDYIVSRESGWNAAATNKSSGAYGLCQALPGTKMASTGSDWRTNAVTQLKWCSGYATGRYGSWSAAYSFWLSNHWW
jgi:resuscitation-promoting factor RpfB